MYHDDSQFQSPSLPSPQGPSAVTLLFPKVLPGFTLHLGSYFFRLNTCPLKLIQFSLLISSFPFLDSCPLCVFFHGVPQVWELEWVRP